MIEIYSVQIAQYRRCSVLGVEFIDTTVKSGDPVFAPTWEIVMGHKAGSITDQEYTQVYHQLMQKSYQQNKSHWLTTLRKPKIAIGCYCPAGAFCHRHILIGYFAKVCEYNQMPYRLMGEIKKVNSDDK